MNLHAWRVNNKFNYSSIIERSSPALEQRMTGIVELIVNNDLPL